MSSNQKVIVYKFSSDIAKKLCDLSVLDNYHGAFALIEDWVVILFAVIMAKYCFYLYPLSLIIIGSRQRALSTIMHDSAHGTIAKNKTLNLMLGTIFSGYWLFQGLMRYKDTHVKKHHAFLGDRKLDPDFIFYIESGLYDPDLNAKKILWRHVVATLLLFRAPGYLVYLVKNRISSASSYPLEFICMSFAWSMMFIIANHYNFIDLIVLYWIVPYLTTHIIIGYFIEIAEHYPFLGKSNEIIHLSRNRLSHWLEGLLFSIHNENYHLVHHLRPRIPFWNMVEAHKIMMQDYNYSLVNKKFGGIFVSSNNVNSLFSELIRVA